jgi:hypothetical protein
MVCRCACSLGLLVLLLPAAVGAQNGKPSAAYARFVHVNDTVRFYSRPHSDSLLGQYDQETFGVLDSIARDTAFIRATRNEHDWWHGLLNPRRTTALVRIPLADVRSAEVGAGTYRPVIRNALIGAALGGFVAAAVWVDPKPCPGLISLCFNNFDLASSRGRSAELGAMQGAFVGALTGLRQRPHWVAASIDSLWYR